MILISPVHSALYSGVGVTEAFVRIGSDRNIVVDQESFSGGESMVLSELNLGLLSSTVVQTSWNGSLQFRAEIIEIIDPITFSTQTFTSTVTLTHVSSTLSLGGASVFQAGSDLRANAPIISSSMTVAGSYEVEGPSSSVVDTFSVTGGSVIDFINSPNYGLVLSELNVPDSFKLSSSDGLPGFYFAEDVEIYNVVVDGQSFVNSITSGRVDFGEFESDSFAGNIFRSGLTINSVPEPEVAILFSFVGFCFLLRRRK